MKASNVIAALCLLLLASLLIWGAGAVAQPRKDQPTAKAKALSKEDNAAIRKVFSDWEAAWNSHDMKALVKLYREDAEAINVVGMYWRGRDVIEKTHTAYHETIFKKHNCKVDDVTVRSIGEGYAIAVVTMTGDAFTTPAGQNLPSYQNRITFVLTKAEDGWKVVHFQNTKVDADAAKHDPANPPKK
jgi:uncharacterized protein (TIGR02246 family)